MNTTNKAQFTAGEWHVTANTIRSESGLLIATMQNHLASNQVPQEANARLIASAPLMLKALESVLNMGDDYEAEKLVRLAIKTAKGE